MQLDSPAGKRCSVSCSLSYPSGATVTLAADAVEGSYLQGWGGDCSGTAYTCTLVMDADRNVSATFAAYSWQLTVTVTGNGSVSSSDGQINCGSQCSATYGFGAYVTLNATPEAGHSFLGWGGSCSGTNASCFVGMFGPTSVSADFD